MLKALEDRSKTIPLEATRLAKVDAAYELTVEDNGPGVAVEQRENLGRRLFRGEAREAEGSGLGLSLVARIAELHGATTSMVRAKVTAACACAFDSPLQVRQRLGKPRRS